MKPGWKTTEFWVTVATNLWAAIGPDMPPLARTIIPAVATAAYAFARAYVKRHSSPAAPAAVAAVTVEK